MMSDREKFLNRIRTQINQDFLPEATSEPPAPPSRFRPKMTLSDRIKAFKRELEALSGYVYTSNNEDEILSLILKILHHHQADYILAWEEAYLELSWLPAALQKDGFVIETGYLVDDPFSRQAQLAHLDTIQVGITGARAALSDSGTLVLGHGPGRGRLASSLPPIHIALLTPQKIYPSLSAFLEADPTAVTESSNLVFIAGPSRTADIEMTLSMGVHGPGEVHVIILPH